jgi:hypothetical protein
MKLYTLKIVVISFNIFIYKNKEMFMIRAQLSDRPKLELRLTTFLL